MGSEDTYLYIYRFSFIELVEERKDSREGKYIGRQCPPFAERELSRTIGHQHRTPESIRPFVGPAAGFPDFGRRGWTSQANRLPWRPYGLIRANIISEDARKNRRISENSFGQLVGFLFFPCSFLLSLVSFLTSFYRRVRSRPNKAGKRREERETWGPVRNEQHRSLAPTVRSTNSSLT